jgi:hypothetical protein
MNAKIFSASELMRVTSAVRASRCRSAGYSRVLRRHWAINRRAHACLCIMRMRTQRVISTDRKGISA